MQTLHSQLISEEIFKTVVKQAVDKILQRHLPSPHSTDRQQNGQSRKQGQQLHHGGDTTDDEQTGLIPAADDPHLSADFLIAEAESIRRFVSKLVVFEKSRRPRSAPTHMRRIP